MELDLNFLLSILLWFLGNASIPVLVPLIVDLLKRIPGLVKDGTSLRWASTINLLGMVGFSIFFFLSPSTSFPIMDETLTTLLRIATIILGQAAELFVGPAMHNAGIETNSPLLGYSLTENGID